MKNTILKAVLTSFLVASISALFAAPKSAAFNQTKEQVPRVFAVINKADWCPTCRSNDVRMISEVLPACKNLNVKFLPNDLTNAETIAKSGENLQNYNLLSIVQTVKSTGVILLIDAKTKKLIEVISVAKPSEEIIKAITLAQS